MLRGEKPPGDAPLFRLPAPESSHDVSHKLLQTSPSFLFVFHVLYFGLFVSLGCQKVFQDLAVLFFDHNCFMFSILCLGSVWASSITLDLILKPN